MFESGINGPRRFFLFTPYRALPECDGEFPCLEYAPLLECLYFLDRCAKRHAGAFGGERGCKDTGLIEVEGSKDLGARRIAHKSPQKVVGHTQSVEGAFAADGMPFFRGEICKLSPEVTLESCITICSASARLRHISLLGIWRHYVRTASGVNRAILARIFALC